MTATAKSPLRYRTQDGKWKFVLTEDFTVHLGLFARGSHIFIDSGRTIARLDGSLFTVFAGYAIDGCSPAISLFGIRIGTPSPDSTLAGAFVHDCLYQFGALPCAPWTYEQADTVFYDLMRGRGFPLAGIYFGAVAILGGVHRRLTRKPSRSIACLTHF